MDQLRDMVWRQAAGVVYPEDLPDIAADALARGLDSPALRELAGSGRGSDTVEILGLYRQALAELDVTIPDTVQAIRWWLRELAGALTEGRITVAVLAERIVPAEDWMTEDEFGFAYLAYYWQELVELTSAEHVRDAETDLLSAAQAVLARPVC